MSEPIITNIKENNFSGCAKVSHGRLCRHRYNRQAMNLRSNAPTGTPRYQLSFTTLPRENVV